ncbi:MAG: hypothetical protein HN348_04235 [Proteobacteria bacterium]|jgi:hypothetical protein|nr:hypothetical protein [Pseudomonadota bacterium]
MKWMGATAVATALVVASVSWSELLFPTEVADDLDPHPTVAQAGQMIAKHGEYVARCPARGLWVNPTDLDVFVDIRQGWVTVVSAFAEGEFIDTTRQLRLTWERTDESWGRCEVEVLKKAS